MARTVDKDKKVIDEFTAFDKKMEVKTTGLTLPGDFEITVFHNKTLQSPSIVTIGEYGSIGSYWIEWTPDKLGFWEVEVKVVLTGQYWYETFDCVYARDPGDPVNKTNDIRGTVVWNSQRDELVALAWLTKNGEIVTIDGDCYWDFYNSDNALLFSIQQLTPYSTGVYRAKKGNPGFDVEENYYYICKIHDGTVLRTSGLGFITII